VPIEGDVERAPRGRLAFALADERRESVGQLDSAALDADQDQAVGATVELHDLAGHALERAVDRSGIEERYGILSHAGGKYSPPDTLLAALEARSAPRALGFGS